MPAGGPEASPAGGGIDTGMPIAPLRPIPPRTSLEGRPTMGREAPEATDRSATAAAWSAPPALISSQPPQRRHGGAVGDHGADAWDKSPASVEFRRPLRAIRTVAGASGEGQRGYPRTSSDPGRSCPRIRPACGEPCGQGVGRRARARPTRLRIPGAARHRAGSDCGRRIRQGRRTSATDRSATDVRHLDLGQGDRGS